jgi:hypothetical protein
MVPQASGSGIASAWVWLPPHCIGICDAYKVYAKQKAETSSHFRIRVGYGICRRHGLRQIVAEWFVIR